MRDRTPPPLGTGARRFGEIATVVARRKGSTEWKWCVTRRGTLAPEPTWMTEAAAASLLARMVGTNRDYEFSLADRKARQEAR
jgi:hypothetical protein